MVSIFTYTLISRGSDSIKSKLAFLTLRPSLPPDPLGAKPMLWGVRPPPFPISLNQFSNETIYLQSRSGWACFSPGKVVTFSFQILSVRTCGRQVAQDT